MRSVTRCRISLRVEWCHTLLPSFVTRRHSGAATAVNLLDVLEPRSRNGGIAVSVTSLLKSGVEREGAVGRTAVRFVADVGAVVIEFTIGEITAFDREHAPFADLPDEPAAGADFNVTKDGVIQIS